MFGYIFNFPAHKFHKNTLDGRRPKCTALFPRPLNVEKYPRSAFPNTSGDFVTQIAINQIALKIKCDDEH